MTFLPFSLTVQSCKSVTVTTRLALKTLVCCDFELNRSEPEALMVLVYCDYEIETGFMNRKLCANRFVFDLFLCEGKYSEKQVLYAWFLCLLLSDKTINDLCEI